MTDIVERLRSWRMDVDSPDVVYEAADEIERLRRQRDGDGDVESGKLWRTEHDLSKARNEWRAQVGLRRVALVERDALHARIDAALDLAHLWSGGVCLTGYRVSDDDNSESPCLHCAAIDLARALGVEDGEQT